MPSSDDDDGGVLLGRAVIRQILEALPEDHPLRAELEAKLAEVQEGE
jgi:hypothetical protein